MIDRRRFLTTAAAGLAMPMVLRGAHAQGAETTLRLHHFLPAASNVHANFLTPWSEEIREASSGRLAIEIFPAMQLGGAPPQLYDQARDGVVDIIWTLAGYTPGRFPRLEVFDLPFVAAQRGVVNSKAIQDFATNHAEEEFPDTHPLVVWGQDHGVIHAKSQIQTLEDFGGKRLRSPTRLTGEGLAALGATVVSMPVPQVPEALAQGVIDGLVVPWEVVPSIRVHELTGFHTVIPGTPTLYTTAFLLVMNPASYQNLPEELRQVLDEKSGQYGAQMAGRAFDALNDEVVALVTENGNTITEITEEEKARWIEATEPVITNWLAAAEENGLDGEALLEEARALIAKYDQPQ